MKTVRHYVQYTKAQLKLRYVQLTNDASRHYEANIQRSPFAYRYAQPRTSSLDVQKVHSFFTASQPASQPVTNIIAPILRFQGTKEFRFSVGSADESITPKFHWALMSKSALVGSLDETITNFPPSAVARVRIRNNHSDLLQETVCLDRRNGDELDYK